MANSPRPERKLIVPPDPLVALPEVTQKPPARPAVEVPDAREIPPLLPVLELPELNMSIPPAPPSPPFEVQM